MFPVQIPKKDEFFFICKVSDGGSSIALFCSRKAAFQGGCQVYPLQKLFPPWRFPLNWSINTLTRAGDFEALRATASLWLLAWLGIFNHRSAVWQLMWHLAVMWRIFAVEFCYLWYLLAPHMLGPCFAKSCGAL